DQARRVFFPLAQTPERGDTHEHEEGGHGGDVMRIKVRIKINAKGKGKKANKDPRKPKLAHAQKKERQGKIQRTKKEEPGKAHAVREALKITRNRIGTLAVNGRLKLVVELLLHGQST